jgi:hypothetical protein
VAVEIGVKVAVREGVNDAAREGLNVTVKGKATGGAWVCEADEMTVEVDV